MARGHLLIMLGVVALARSAAAQSCEDTSALRAELKREAINARRWNYGWAIGYSAVAATQFAIAASGALDHDNTASLWVGGAKSALGGLARWTSPLRIEVPLATGDPCEDRSALRHAAERAADEERRVFWTGHIGGLLVHAAATIILVETASWRTAALSFATGYPVGLLSTYTMPRASWKRIREPSWSAAVISGNRQTSLVVMGSF
jgi:hypothetical protein